MSDQPKLGSCCVCGTLEGVRNIVMLSRRAPVPGTGWGCVVCDLPCDGALTVTCDACVGQSPAYVCSGYPGEGGRVPIASLPLGVFDHDMSKHTEDEGRARL